MTTYLVHRECGNEATYRERFPDDSEGYYACDECDRFGPPYHAQRLDRSEVVEVDVEDSEETIDAKRSVQSGLRHQFVVARRRTAQGDRRMTAPIGACGGGECEYDMGQWVLCDLHHREVVGAVDPKPEPTGEELED